MIDYLSLVVGNVFVFRGSFRLEYTTSVLYPQECNTTNNANI